MTTREIMSVEVLSQRKWEGAYGFTGESRLVKRGDKCWLIHDHFCGMDSPRGGALRAHVYGVPTEKFEEVLSCFTDADQFIDPSRPELGTNWGYLCTMLLADLPCYGLQADLRWAKNL